MIDLHELANRPGWGKAHSELSRAGHPTEKPRSADEIEYCVTVQGPFGDRQDIEVMAESVSDAIARARECVERAGLVGFIPNVCDLDQEVRIVSVAAYD